METSALQRHLAAAVKGEVRFDKATRGMYSTDAGVYQIFPTGVVIPASVEDVIQTLRICREFGVSITGRGGGTSQGGQAIGAGISLDFSKYMRRILELDLESATVRVEPGIVVAELNQQLQPHGLHLPLDLSTANRATLGGMISNNSSGTRSVVYGSTIDYVKELTVLLADGSVVTVGPVGPEELEEKCRQEDLEGRIYREARRLAQDHAEEIRARYPKIRRRVGGYNLDRLIPGEAPFDLSKLMVGSEGTLGLILDATLRLVEPPKAKVLAVAQFSTLREALVAVPTILGQAPSAVELLDRNLLAMTSGKPHFEPLRDFVVGDPGALLIIEFMGESGEELPGRMDALEHSLASLGLSAPLHRAVEPRAQARIWELRKAGLGLAMAEVGDTKSHSFVEDTAVAPEHLPEYIDRFQEILDRHDTSAIFYAHASVGLLHIRPAVNLKTVEGVERFKGIAEDVSDLVLDMGGALSAEHGDGLVRSPFQVKMFGQTLYDAFCQLKDAFDPEGILNPGKIVRSQALTENLKFGPEYRTNEISTTFDFSDFQGISRAAEQCAGVGACRKTLTGNMCPSYMATLDEADSTRGRANALRLAISGQLGPGGLTDPALYPVLDLCLECKACKTECPTGVDMARLKSEFLHRYQKEHGVSLRAHLLANAEAAARWGSRLAPLSSWILGNPLARWLGGALLGLEPRRDLPRAVRKTFVRWWREEGIHHAAPEAGPGIGAAQPGSSEPADRRMALFADTFTNHYEPHQGVAAVRVARRLGFRVELAPRVCCGRPLISKGFLDRAREQAAATAETLFPLAQAGTPIVFCEPGCFSAVKDDHPLLLRGELREKAEEVSAACLTFEEWAEGALADRSGSGTIAAPPGPTRVLLHGHCHQKALVGLGPISRLLSRVPGWEVVDADAACCGMAGSFGYEKEHYAVSKAVGERKLFPAIRKEGPDTLLVVPGFSCRHQIRHFTPAEPLSVMELMERVVRE